MATVLGLISVGIWRVLISFWVGELINILDRTFLYPCLVEANICLFMLGALEQTKNHTMFTYILWSKFCSSDSAGPTGVIITEVYHPVWKPFYLFIFHFALTFYFYFSLSLSTLYFICTYNVHFHFLFKVSTTQYWPGRVSPSQGPFLVFHFYLALTFYFYFSLSLSTLHFIFTYNFSLSFFHRNKVPTNQHWPGWDCLS